MKSKINVKLWVRIILLIFIAATVIYIFVNSMMPPEVSSSQSDTVGEIVDAVIPDHVEAKPTIINNIRKIAHFTEYGLLGIEVALYVILFHRRRWYLFIPLSYGIPFAVGFADESIQVLSSRGPQITDVWIDAGGFATFASIVYLIYGAVLMCAYFIKRVKAENKGI